MARPNLKGWAYTKLGTGNSEQSGVFSSLLANIALYGAVPTHGPSIDATLARPGMGMLTCPKFVDSRRGSVGRETT